MVRLRRGFGDGKVEAVKLFFAGDETSSGSARVRWRVRWQNSDEAKKRIPRGIRIYL